MSKALLNPVELAGKTLNNRIVLPPMTRSRANNPEQAATALMADYYAQRATAGLMISEGTQVSPLGKGYAWTPGIYSAAQIHGWQQVTDRVHQSNPDATFFAQLWHVGRVTHPDNIGGCQPISSSAIAAKGVQVFVDNGKQEPGFVDVAVPRQMTTADIQSVIEEFKAAAQNALEAGFDGVELHAANGYLVNQFIDSEANSRTDEYGGSLANRLRFLDEVISAMVEAIGKDRIGVRLAPLTTLNGTVDKNPEETYTAAAKLLNRHGIAYLHIAEADWDDAPVMRDEFKQAIRDSFEGVLIYAGKYTVERAEKAIKQGLADMIAFGRPFVANPDLPARIQQDLPWAEHDASTLFGGGAQGLTDYQTATACQQPTHEERPAMSRLFDTFDLQGNLLANRVAMAPMTRSRTTQPGDVPNDMMASYYSQRASAGLIITEGAPISAAARGYSMTPGIYSQAHIEGWQKTTQAVHRNGGKIFVQLWHVGRRSHQSIAGTQPLSASAIKEPDQVFGPDSNSASGFGMIETGEPRAMSKTEIDQTIADFVAAAKNAMAAGFDGVEIHGAHGYLLDQFMRLASNTRTDAYGGSQENRMRFTLEVVNAVAAAIGADKVAIRLSPFVTEGYREDDPEIVELTLKLIERLAPLGLAYLHFSENISKFREVTETFRKAVRARYPHPIMVAGKQTRATATEILNKGYADMVAFGQPFITNPDLVHRMQHGIELTPVDYDAHSTFYGGGEEGYTDYPPASKTQESTQDLEVA